MAKHRWYNEIMAWAEGGVIECHHLYGADRWMKVEFPDWQSSVWEYRIKPTSDKYNKEKEAYSKGKVIQFRQMLNEKWVDITGEPHWYDDFEYRIKPTHPNQEWIDKVKEGKKVEYFDPISGSWKTVQSTSWIVDCTDVLYRDRPQHPNQDVIDAWKNGAKAQVREIGEDTWGNLWPYNESSFTDTTNREYRFQKEDIVTYDFIRPVNHTLSYKTIEEARGNSQGFPLVKAIWDYDTHQLKEVELI